MQFKNKHLIVNGLFIFKYHQIVRCHFLHNFADSYNFDTA